MDRIANRFDAETLVPTATSTSVGAKSRPGKRAKTAARARRAEFETHAAAIRGELSPIGAIESICVDRVVVASWRLREAVASERAGLLGLAPLGGDSPDLFAHASDRADRSLRRALDSLQALRASSRPTGWGHSDHPATPVFESDFDAMSEADFGDDLASNEWPILPTDHLESSSPETEPEADDAPLPRWQDRLVFDFSVSEDSPVVRGTWVTVAQVVSLIVDGSTWADILRSHPELTEDDLRVCLAYATEQEGDAGRI